MKNAPFTRRRVSEERLKMADPPSTRRKHSSPETRVGNEIPKNKSTKLLHKRYNICNSGTFLSPDVLGTTTTKNVQETILEFPLPIKKQTNMKGLKQDSIQNVSSEFGSTYTYLSNIMEAQK